MKRTHIVCALGLVGWLWLAASSVAVAQQTLQVSGLRDTTLCTGSTLALAPVVQGGTGRYTYQWSTGDSTATLRLRADKPLSLRLRVFDGNTSTEQKIEIGVHPPLVAQIEMPTDTACPGSAFFVSTNVKGGLPGATLRYAWTDAQTQVPLGSAESLKLAAKPGMQLSLKVEDGCSAPATVTGVPVRVYGKPVVHLSSRDTLLCVDASLVLSAKPTGGKAPYTLRWESEDDDATGERFRVEPEEDQQVRLQVRDACGSVTDTSLSIRLRPEPEFAFEVPDKVCVGQVFTLAAKTQAGSPKVQLAWELGGAEVLKGDLRGQGPLQLRFMQAGNPQLMLKLTQVFPDAQCGPYAGFVPVRVLPQPKASISASATEMCLADNQFDFTAHEDNPTTRFAYTWRLPPGSSPATGTDFRLVGVRFAEAGPQTVRVQVYGEDSLCSTEASLQVNVLPQPAPPQGVSDTVCPGNANRLQVRQPEAGFRYEWFREAQAIGTGTTLQGPALTTPTTFRLKATNPKGCSTWAEREIASHLHALPNVEIQPTARQVTLPGPPLNLTAKADKPLQKVRWDITDGTQYTTPTVAHRFRREGRFTIQLLLTDTDGCEGKATPVEIAVRELYFLDLPEQFSLSRDRLLKANHRKIKSLKLELYNTRGEVIYTTYNINFQWNGTAQGGVVPPGKYGWAAIITTLDGKEYQETGSVNIVR